MTVCPMRDAGAAPQPHFRGAPPRQAAGLYPGRKDEEFVADFCLVARRALSDSEHKLFRYHFLLGADWKLCTRKLGIDRGTFFHRVYRIEQKLGRVFRELEPYGLFPLDEYFHGPSRLGVAPHTPPRRTGPSILPERLQFPGVKRAA